MIESYNEVDRFTFPLLSYVVLAPGLRPDRVREKAEDMANDQPKDLAGRGTLAVACFPTADSGSHLSPQVFIP